MKHDKTPMSPDDLPLDERKNDVTKRRTVGTPNTFKIGFLTFNVNGVDLVFSGLVLVLLIFGLVMMFSASYAYAYYHEDNSFYYITRQAIFALLGVAVMFAVSFVDYHVWHKFAGIIYVVSLIMLVMALFYPARANVHRWIWFGPLTIQPSEVAKLGIILLFADFSVKFRNEIRIHSFLFGVLPFMLMLIPIVILLVLEPHLSGTVLCCAIALIMMFVGGTSIRWFVGGGVAVAIGLVGVFLSGVIRYAQARLTVWIDPWSDKLGKGWQTIQSLYAIASGGVTGVGLGNSRQKQLYISEPQNDFVFAVVCEELGLIGASVVIILFALLVWRGFVVGLRAPDAFGMLLSVGMTAQVGLQAALNIAVVTNTIPNTGISLPFFSYGGSSLVMLLFEMGIVMSVSRRSRLKKS